jgi:hypothetical protein
MKRRIFFVFLLLVVAVPAPTSCAYAADITLAWDANTQPTLAGYKLYYGAASGQYSTEIDVGNVTTYIISNLGPGTYYFAVKAYSTLGEFSDYSNETTATVSAIDTQPPVISGIAVTSVTWSAVAILWMTDEPSDGQVEYGTSTAYGFASVLDPVPATAHSCALSGLVGGMTYHYRVLSRDAAGNLTTSGDFTFTTPVPPDTTPPTISAVASSNLTSSGATISWTTNEASDSQVEYGTTTSYGNSTALATSMVTAHAQSLTALSAATTYHYRVKSKDAAGNSARSADYTLTTTALTDITSGLVAAYAFDEGTGATAADSSGSGNTATLHSVTWTGNAKFGNALSFNGSTSYLSAGTVALPAVNGPKTISCWFYLSSKSNSSQSVIVLANQAQSASVQTGSKGSKIGALQFGDTWLVASNMPSLKTWHHFAYAFDGVQNRLYIDGVLAGTSTISLRAAAVTSFQIGRWIAGSEYFKGAIDDVRVYNRALNSQEIKALMTTPVVGIQLMKSAPAATAAALQDDPASEEKPATVDAGMEGVDADPASRFVSRPIVDVHMSKRVYRPGDTVGVRAYWISNPSGDSRGVELKTWIAAPGLAPIPAGNMSLEEVTILPAGLDRNFAPMPLFQVSANLPEGSYEFNARMIDPVTGDVLSEAINPFSVAVPGSPLMRNRPAPGNSPAYPELVMGGCLTGSDSDVLELSPECTISNQGAVPASIELKVWLEAPGRSSIPLISLGADHALILPAGAELSLKPLASLDPARDVSPGIYQLKFRILDPTTGQFLYESTVKLR